MGSLHTCRPWASLVRIRDRESPSRPRTQPMPSSAPPCHEGRGKGWHRRLGHHTQATFSSWDPIACAWPCSWQHQQWPWATGPSWDLTTGNPLSAVLTSPSALFLLALKTDTSMSSAKLAASVYKPYFCSSVQVNNCYFVFVAKK